MSSDVDSSEEDGATPQQMYYRRLFFLENHGTPEQVAKYKAGGPPPPLADDGVTGKILWFEQHPPSADEVATLLGLMEKGGWITSTERERVVDLSTAQIVAALKAHMIERDSVQRPLSGME